jgi:NADH-quinone oxidoreductase subunit C
VSEQQPPADANGDGNLPAKLGAERLEAPVIRQGMFGVHGTPDTSGYGKLKVHQAPTVSTPRPYGGYFDEIADALGAALAADENASAEGTTTPDPLAGTAAFDKAIERVVVDRGEVTFYTRRENLVQVMSKLLHDPALRFELFSGVSGVHYPNETGRELRAVYHLTSITHNRRLRLEVSAPDSDPHIPSVTSVYPAANWHERETWDFFGIIFDGHPALTRIEMPDDWRGHPQRKDYPLGGVPVEYRGTKVPPPDERRSYS